MTKELPANDERGPFRVALVCSGTPKSPWRETREEAIEDAIALDYAYRDDDDPTEVIMDPFVMIESRG